MRSKKELALEVRTARMRLGLEKREALSGRIQERILAHPWYGEAKILLSYVSFGDEAGTDRLIRRALADGKAVFAPRVFGRGRMEFYSVNDPDDLVINAMGIPEPDPSREERFDTGRFSASGRREDCLVILPGLVFDRQGGRIGYGGGYYDRYLEAFSARRLLAPAFSLQVFPRIPQEPHDIPADLVITETDIYSGRK